MLLMVPLMVGSPLNGLLDARSLTKLLSCAAQYVEALIAAAKKKGLARWYMVFLSRYLRTEALCSVPQSVGVRSHSTWTGWSHAASIDVFS